MSQSFLQPNSENLKSHIISEVYMAGILWQIAILRNNFEKKKKLFSAEYLLQKNAVHETNKICHQGNWTVNQYTVIFSIFYCPVLVWKDWWKLRELYWIPTAYTPDKLSLVLTSSVCWTVNIKSYMTTVYVNMTDFMYWNYICTWNFPQSLQHHIL